MKIFLIKLFIDFLAYSQQKNGCLPRRLGYLVHQRMMRTFETMAVNLMRRFLL